MRIDVETDPSLREIEVLVRCAVADERVAAIVASLRMHDRRVSGLRDGELCVVAAGDILYLDSVDGRTFAYTSDAVLEPCVRLCELEERLAEAGFVRASKSCLVNLCRIQALRPYVGGRLLARLANGEDVVISRKYATEVKRTLGVS